MWFVLAGCIVVLGFIRLIRISYALKAYPLRFDGVFIGLYLLWMIMELRVSKKDADVEGKKTSDFMTCQLYGTGQAFIIIAALWFPSHWLSLNIAHITGISLFFCGACYRLWAVITLGEFYSHRIRIISRHRIIDAGPYRLTRHPAYAGMIIANAGIVLYFFNLTALCALLFVLMPAILLRILLEEKVLFGIDGYAEYAANRKRLFPSIW